MLIISSDDAGITINQKFQKQTEGLQWERRIRRRKQCFGVRRLAYSPSSTPSSELAGRGMLGQHG